MIETTLAAAGLAICLVLFVRLLLSKPRQRRFDDQARRIWWLLKYEASNLWHWRSRRRNAQKAATEAIERASKQAAARRTQRDDGVWKGNVYESKTFRKPRKPH